MGEIFVDVDGHRKCSRLEQLGLEHTSHVISIQRLYKPQIFRAMA